ncbi:hypothetical protein [Streptomyces luteolus]|uniref:Uncharacterized protein n=1 Tax=Streptomyces luteolus TaxID=3043615 RepID=A0ABT6SV60_9ACTN|nr:hypothetical protein [Streptomyces sp. B-S-A12]MDI3419503.1 hypothetical protein [Streptomyces sp. B-S-A12]
MAGNDKDTQQPDRVAQQAPLECRARFDRDGEGLTYFQDYSVNGLRQMILGARPGELNNVAGRWRHVHQLLSGGDGDGARGEVDRTSSKESVAGLLQKAVDDSLEHWRGEAAEGFRKRAEVIVRNIRNGAAFANLTAMNIESASDCLRTAQEEMRGIEVPSLSERAKDKLGDDRDGDGQMRKDMADGVDAEAAARANETNLSIMKERQLHAVAVMERLAVNYSTIRSNITPPSKRWDDGSEIPAPGNNVVIPPVPGYVGASTGPGASGAGQRPWSAGNSADVGPAPTGPRNKGITGGAQLPGSKTQTDSVSPGLKGRGQTPGLNGPNGLGGGGSTGPGGTPGGPIATPRAPGLGGGRGGVGGPRGGASGPRGVGIPGGPGGSAAGRGGAGAGRGAAGAGRGAVGIGGMGGGVGAGAGGRGAAGGSGRGSLAKTRGGVVGAAKGMPEKGTGTGTGLHGSRGGWRGQMAERRAEAGLPGSNGRKNRRTDDDEERGQRPDYLVEDEDTWVSDKDRKQNMPKNIE